MENKNEVNQLISVFAEAGNSAVAFSTYDGERLRDITYSQFCEDILKVAGCIQQRKITGQHIAIVAQDSYEYIAVFLGIAASGNTVVLLNPNLPQEELNWQYQWTDVSWICGADAAELVEKTNAPKQMLLTYGELFGAAPANIESLPGLNDDDTLLMMFTSGTTGKSKAIEISVYNVFTHTEDAVLGTCDGTSRILAVVPLYHVMGLIECFVKLYQKQTVCIGRGARYMIQDMPMLNPDRVSMVPSILESLYKMLKCTDDPKVRQKYIGNNLKHITVGGASVNLKICRLMMEMGFHVQTGYGMTESCGSGTWCIWDAETLGSIGKLYGRTECRIQDGELLLRSPSVMKGYYKDPEATAEVIRDGWIYTGDMGYCDENGNYYLTGRKKNVIILSNGENVNPEEIEAKFGACGDILECLVYSDGKGICADVYAQDEAAAAAYIKAYNAERPFYRQVYKVNFTKEPLEKTGSGKIKRKGN